MELPAYFKYAVLSALLLLGSLSMLSTTKKVIQSSKRLDHSQKEILGLKQEKKELEQTIEYKKSDDFVEKEARNALSMVKPGEEIYIYPEEQSKAEKTGEYEAKKPSEKTQEMLPTQPKEPTPLEEWKELLF
jgi:cell division protein FtsB